MPHAELYRYTYMHEGIAAVMEALTELAARMSVASAIAKRAPEGRWLHQNMRAEQTISVSDFIRDISAKIRRWNRLGHQNIELRIVHEGQNAIVSCITH
jgi:hypothetical protein